MVQHTLSLRFSLSLLASSLIATASAVPLTPRSPTCTLPANSTASSIEWTTCPPEASVPDNVQCASFSVPIDWDEPHGAHFNLALVRVPATPSNSSSRLGSLFINPGGPGGSAIELVVALAAGGESIGLGPLLESFDVIGLDPRGVGFSNPVKCDMGIWAERVSLFPETQEEFEQLVEHNRRLGESCLNMTGPLLAHVDTISAAKDHEAVRIALNDGPLNFVGLSYGTQLGAQYAALFPDNIRTLLLDSMLQHSQSEAANILTESTSYQLVLTDFFAWAATNETSVLHGRDVEALWRELLANATQTPIPAPTCNGTTCRTDVNAEEILFNSQAFLHFKPAIPGLGASWADFASALHNASQGDASALSSSLTDPSAISGLAVECLDWTHNASLTLAGMRAKKAMAEHYAPLTQGASQSWALQHQCLGWPVPVANPPAKLHVKTDAPIVMVNSYADPSTGFPWALGMLEEIDNKVFVSRDGVGHTSFALGGETTQVEIEYLITGRAPRDGLVTRS